MAAGLAEVLKDPRIWKGKGSLANAQPGASTGFVELDAELPGGGWPLGSVSEIVSPQAGDGVMSLLQPALSRQSRQVVLIAPPFIPYAPALSSKKIDLRRLTWIVPGDENEKLWALEQALREPACGAVVAWQSQALPDRLARRLQLAAEAGGALAFMVRLDAQENLQSPFALRLSVAPHSQGLRIDILKRRGSPLKTPLLLPLYRQEHHALRGPLPTAAGAGRIPARANLYLAQ